MARTPCFPTEDKEKVRQALLNIFPQSEIEENENEMIARSDSGDKLRQIILDHHIRDTARSILLCGCVGKRTFFRLNKQVASVGKISFVEGAPPLGSIDVEIEAEDLDGAIDFLAESTVEVNE